MGGGGIHSYQSTAFAENSRKRALQLPTGVARGEYSQPSHIASSDDAVEPGC